MTAPDLRPYQQSVIGRLREEIAAGRHRLLLVAPTGSGKCLGEGTPVLLYDGRIKAVEKIIVGDLLMGPDSQPRKVISLARGREELFRISPTKGIPYVVNRSHILSLKMTGGALRSCGISDGTVVNLTIDDYLSRTKSFRHCAKGWRAAVDFPHHTEPLRLPAYFLGVWLGDGHSRIPSITTGDREIVDYLEEYAASLKLFLRKEPNSPGSEIYHITTCVRTEANPVTSSLRQYGVLKHKHIPHRYLTGSRTERRDLLAGILDADGYWDGGGFEIALKSERLLDDVIFVARSLGFSAYKTRVQKTCTNNGAMSEYWKCSINGPVDTIPCKISRKRAPPRLQKKNPLVTGITAESIGEGEYYGFELQGRDRLFLLGDFTVTHNTVIAAAIIESAAAKGNSVLFLDHRKEITEQTSRKLHAVGVDHGIIQAGFPARPGERVQVASIQTLHARAIRSCSIDLPDAAVVVIDEAHHARASTYREILDAYPNAVILGLTATPCRGDGRGLGNLFEALVECPQVAELTAAGYLVPARIYAPSRPDLTGVRIARGDYVERELGERVNTVELVGDIVEHWLKLAERRRTVLFAAGVAHSVHLRDEFRAAGVLAEHIDGSTPREEREQILARVATGQVELVSNAAVLTEGWDSPAVSCLVLARPTKSLGLFRQIVGRVLRPYPGKEDCLILDHAGAVFEHGFPDDPIKWELREDRRAANPRQAARGGGRLPALTTCPECRAVRMEGKPCPACGWRPTAKPEIVEVQAGNLGRVDPARRPQQLPLATVEERLQFHRELLWIAQERGRKPGWAAHHYRNKFGTWPPTPPWNAPEPAPAGTIVRAWVRSRDIAYAKAMQNRGAA